MQTFLGDKIRELDLVSIISDYIPLKKVGSNYVAKCPFHDDKTPSFYVSPDKKLWKCFGCGEGGNVVKFIALYENISYKEALLRLNERYKLGIKIKDEEKDESIYSLMREVCEHYHKNLLNSKEAITYLKERKISSNTIEEFKIGYAKAQSLIPFLKEINALKEYEKTKNLLLYQDGSYSDIFKNRIIIPIFDTKKRVVAFAGRSIDDKTLGPKYINSPESSLFKKSHILFGLSHTKEYISCKDEAIIVEGYFDLIKLYQKGIRNVVATLGTAVTKTHIDTISNYTKNVSILTDSDEAGAAAAKKIIKLCLEKGINPKRVLINDPLSSKKYKDPDEFLNENDPQKLIDLIESTKPILEILEEKIINRIDLENTLKEYFEFIASLSEDKRLSKALFVSKEIGISPNMVLEQIKKVSQREIPKKDINLSFKDKIVLKAYIDGFLDKDSILSFYDKKEVLTAIEAIEQGETNILEGLNSVVIKEEDIEQIISWFIDENPSINREIIKMRLNIINDLEKEYKDNKLKSLTLDEALALKSKGGFR